jgi:hypothetical protein
LGINRTHKDNRQALLFQQILPVACRVHLLSCCSNQGMARDGFSKSEFFPDLRVPGSFCSDMLLHLLKFFGQECGESNEDTGLPFE